MKNTFNQDIFIFLCNQVTKNNELVDFNVKKIDEFKWGLNTKYYEMPNSYYYDFGKWIYAKPVEIDPILPIGIHTLSAKTFDHSAQLKFLFYKGSIK